MMSASLPLRRHLILFAALLLVTAAVAAEPPRRPGAPTDLAATVGPVASGMDVALGGDDVLIESTEFFPDPDLVIASDGTIFVADFPLFSSSGIDVYRSLDGGRTFELWSAFDDPAAAVRGGEVLLAEGSVDRIFLAYQDQSGDGSVKVAYADPASASPTWTITTALASPGVDLGLLEEVSIATDAAVYSGYYLYLANRGRDGDGDDLWFTRSTDQGATWEAPYRAVSFSAGTGAHYLRPHLAYGSGGYVHLAYNWIDPAGVCTSMHRRIPDDADGGAGAWSAQTILEGGGALFTENAVVGIAADVSGGGVFVQHRRSGDTSLLRWSVDQGAAWSTANSRTTDLDPFLKGEMDLNPADGTLWLLGTNDLSGHPDLEIRTQVFHVDDPANPDPVRSFSREPWDVYNHRYGLARDPSRGDRRAVVWQTYRDDAYHIFFDAEWLRDEGNPVTEIGFPVDIPGGGGFTPPAVADIDADPYGEIVFATLPGMIYVVSHLGTIPGGWPVDLGVSVPIDGPVAVGDLNGDDEPEIVAGSNDGRVFAFSRNGTPLDGFPVDLGTGAATYVSIGALGPPYHRGIVATSDDIIRVLKWDGDVIDPWSGTAVESYTRPAAIGDLDGDGEAEVVVCQQTAIQVRRLSASSVVAARLGFSAPIADMPALGDVDGDGDLEIAVPLEDGSLHLLEHDLSDAPGFPVDVGANVQGVVLANTVSTFDLELVFTVRGGGVGAYMRDGTPVSGFPEEMPDFVYQPPIVTQLGGSPDILVSSGSSVHAWTNLSAVPEGWPRDLGSGCEESPAAGDLDLDGSNEIVVLTDDRLWVFDVNTPPDFGAPGTKWPMYGFDAQRTGCQSCAENTSTAVGDDAAAPTRLAFAPAFPNPASSSAGFRFTVPRDADVSLEMFDARGRRVRTVFQGRVPAGEVVRTWDGRSDSGRRVAQGVYQARLVVRSESGTEQRVRKVLWTD